MYDIFRIIVMAMFLVLALGMSLITLIVVFVAMVLATVSYGLVAATLAMRE